MTRRQLIKHITSILLDIKLNHPVRVAIDGVDGAGKTFLAQELEYPLKKQKVPVIRASIDGFHNPRETRYKRGNFSPDGYFYDSFNYHGLISGLLEPLGEQGNLIYKTAIFDHKTNSIAHVGKRLADPASILLFDGVFLMRDEIFHYWDYKIFVDADFSVNVSRACIRDARAGGNILDIQSKYEQRYVPGQRIYLRTCHPKELADIVIDNNNLANPFIVEKKK